MTKVKINPGVCGFHTEVTAESAPKDKYSITVHVKSGCKTVNEMMEALGDQFSAFDVCLKKPGDGVFYKYARENYVAHAACPIIAGITKCIEAESKLALKRDATITFVEE